MEFKLHPKTQEACEKSVGMSCKDLQIMSLSAEGENLSIPKEKMPTNQVNSRVSIY